MNKQKRLRDYGVTIGKMQPGKKNAITDVKGVQIGHSTIGEGAIQTGVTSILPHTGNLFKEKVIGASHVINGFGKTIGLPQLDELGTIETPILLTNTLSAGITANHLIDYMLEFNPEIGRTTGTINPIVGECNDMILNDIRKNAISKQNVLAAIENANNHVEEGAVGAGRGMVCYSLKGGIGSASRQMTFGENQYTLGVLVLSNFGNLSDLTIDGRSIGIELNKHLNDSKSADKGSIMIVLATDLPVLDRQLKRILKRTVTGLSRTGSIIGHGSGDIAIGFSTATKIPHSSDSEPLAFSFIHEELLEDAFRAAGEATEEAILNSLVTANTVTGRDGNTRYGIIDLLNKYGMNL
ncbi:P1 family peptidase [Allobacillus sp. GCM10007491]|uniref:P1 family peptidase n=1 Tax=Allobacillus saliphilus TaxID=2912308 RepID=A0A941CU58_9BACI|nr:P1 family peptidase [Allobacillus saliphilus]MBR7553176.1 P1 family peptidase [Allobacillus saliphilus]